ncbi:MAG: hypothetical protein D3915_08330 [Candidatus Electrothrix sp. AU1_5]|nr:hypothetical protein [Candidatus Electrothrix gigas]
MTANSPQANQETGGIAALRGFRKQFLHTLNSILSSETGHFYPESLEDFAVRDRSGRVIEVVQVKDYKADLVFSELKTFFERAAEYITDYPDVQIVLASYGKLGPELQECIGADEATLKKKKKFNKPELLKVFQRLKHRPLNEEKELSSIKEQLTQFPLITGDLETAFDLLMQELYRGAEQEKGYTRQDLLERLQQIGQYLTEREAHHREWGTSIIPLLEQEIDDREQLRKAFHEGVSVGWRHILSDLDVKRPQHLNAIQEGFKKTNIVIVHGASGQGKSALAYRYLHDYCPATSYEIRDLSTAKRALEVATALSGYSIPFTFYVDASHNDKGLAEFLQRIHEMPHISCLVTIREEDWRLTGITSADITFADIELVFNRQEAQELYTAWESAEGCRFPDFEQAWAKFLEEGPLLEFVYLLTHTENLHNRLQKQYDQIADEVDCQQRSENDLKLIRQVAVAGACGARIDLARLAQLPGKATLKQSINRLEKEYLLRRSNDARHLTGLHPVRSEILASIIADPVLCSWETLTLECLPLLEDSDVEIFLLHIFRFHSKATSAVLSYLNTAKYETWLAANGVLRALLWLGIYEYIQENEQLIRKVYEKFGAIWWSVLEFDFLGLLEDSTELFKFFPEESRAKIDQWRKEQPCNTVAFTQVDEWLRQIFLPPLPAYKQENDWYEFGQVMYWLGFRKIAKRVDELLDWDGLRQTVEVLPIETLATLIYGLWHSFLNITVFVDWYKDARPALLDRYRRETNTPYLEEQHGVIRAHFVVPLDDKAKNEGASNAAEKNRFHELALYHVDFLAQLAPDCQGYGCQGYGHKIFDIEFHDDTTKTAIRDKCYLQPDWVLHVNKTARILAGHMFRPEKWQDYSRQIFSIRSDAILCLDELRRNLIKHFRSKEVVHELSTFSDNAEWKKTSLQVLRRPSFPVEALGQFGYTEEGLKDIFVAQDHDNKKTEIIISAYLQQYQAYLEATREYFNSVSNFLDLSGSVMLANAFLGKAETSQKRIEIKQQLEDLNFKVSRPFLPTLNLADSIKHLPLFQSSFRKHFSTLVDSEALSQLEQKERTTLHSLWPLWFCFEKTPNRQMTIPRKTASDQLERRQKTLRNKLVKALKQASTESLQFSIQGDSVAFDSKPALCITIDGENPLEVYGQTEQIYKLLRNFLGEIKLYSIDHFALDFQWQKIVFVPLCKGKLLEAQAWIISINKFINELGGDQGLAAYNLIPQQIEQETLEALGLKVWELALLNDAKLFLQGAAALQVRLRHLVQVGEIPDLDETGTEIAQSWIDQTQGACSKDFQQCVDKAASLVSMYDQISSGDDETSANEYLQVAYEQLLEIHEKLVPEELKGGKALLTYETMKEWQEKLLSVQGTVFVIYLYWCGYAIQSYEFDVQ